MPRTIIALLIMSLLPCSARAADEWNPAKTYALVASVIHWPGQAGLNTFTDARRDGDFVQQLVADGVPANQIVFLKDNEATLAAIRKHLRELAARCPADGSLLLYFQGHGSHINGKYFVSTYDVKNDDWQHTAFPLAEIPTTLDAVWHGGNLFLVGDFCFSGGLATIVPHYRDKPGCHCASIASATASNTSTAHWTFTAAIIQALAGNGLVDRNRDGVITLSELDAYVHDEMKYQENQLTGIVQTPGFGPGFILRRVRPGSEPRAIPGALQIGHYISARDQEGNWYTSQILNWRQSDGAYRVHFLGWEDKWDEWVSTDRIRPVIQAPLTIGGHYQVEWQPNDWYPAIVTKCIENYFYFVHFENEDGSYDEWITPQVTRLPGAAPQGNFALGTLVAARWERAWYRARITSAQDGRYGVRYDDHTDGSKLSAADLRPIPTRMQFKTGQHVLACWQHKPQMYPGIVTQIANGLATIKWDDGDTPEAVAFNLIAPY